MPTTKTERLDIGRSDDVVRVRQLTRTFAVEVGLSLVDQTKIVTAASELARNTLDYGGGGEVTLEVLDQGGRRGLRLTFEDKGPGIADVEQCLGIIVTTPRGSDPLRPTFGANIWRYIDFPISLALPAIVSELTSAITMWEPRATLVSVTAQPVLDGSAQSGAHLDVTLNWQLSLGTAAATVQTTTVTVPGTAA